MIIKIRNKRLESEILEETRSAFTELRLIRRAVTSSLTATKVLCICGSERIVTLTKRVW